MTEATLQTTAPVANDPGSFLDTVRDALDAEQWADVKKACDTRLDKDPTDSEALFANAISSFYLQDLSGAAHAAKQGLELAPTTYEFADLLSIFFAMAGDVNTSVFYAKLTTTLTPTPKFAEMMPANFPNFATAYRKISERPLVQRGDYATSIGNWLDAENWYRQHLAFEPDCSDAHNGLARSLLALGEYRAAIETLRAARHMLPNDPRLANHLAKALAAIGHFDEALSVHHGACAAAADDPYIHASALVDQLHDPNKDPATLAAGFAAWGARFGVTSDDPPEYEPPTAKDRLVIGYIVGDRGVTPTGIALAQILMHHDASRYETIGFGQGQLSDSTNIVFQKCMSRWHDISTIDPITLRYIVAAEQVDVLIDVAGFSAPRTLTAFGARLAPCQVAWLESPLGTGLAGMDYRITDRILDPTDPATPADSERLVRLALGSQVAAPLFADDEPFAPREERDDEITFAADATLQEITPTTVELWARVLHTVPNSKIILRDHDFNVQENVTRLISLFGNFGLAHRTDVVTEAMPPKFFELADVALIPLTYPRPQSALDALWGGTPVVCLTGEGRQNRLAASLIDHLDLDAEMLADDADAYVRLAADWAANAERRRALRQDVRERIRGAASFNPTERARDLEDVIESLWEKTCGGT